MKKQDWAERLKKLPPYLFAEIDRQKSSLKEKGVKFIDLSIGDPDILAPAKVIDVIYKSAKVKDNQKYALDQGKLSLRIAIKKWVKNRFAVKLDENKEILPLIGSKEGLVHFPLGFVNKGDYVIIPSPGYPGYRGAALFAGASVYEAALLRENNFLPDLGKVPIGVRNKAKIIYLNYPNNPTTALAPMSFLEKVVKFCSKYGIILAYDNAYSEIYFEDKPHSILEVKGAREIAVEFHSFSKTFCMTGFRIGWAHGASELVSTLLKVKTNIDSGIFGAIQAGARFALEKEQSYVKNLRKEFKNRRDFFIKNLQKIGLGNAYADSTFYVWVKLPRGIKSSMDFVKYLINEKRIIATPGIGFGKYGRGYARFALTVKKDILKKAIDLLEKI
ncbi:MAG: aminotransferase class I/II-fold pyridoxal phosphate-dependent enzyme [Candidatus Omnitrophota bacterium]|nr:MAG: aminotransferase class I/II-fold pyridoxal phosphate-dependent enzyme [Candidatus Omnitrophota bacterium]